MTPGWKTSEFWLSLFALAMPFVTSLSAVPNPWIALPAAGIAAVYAASRSTVKKADALAQAHVEAGTSPLPAFGAMTPEEKAAAAAKDAATAIASAAAAATVAALTPAAPAPTQGPPPAAK